MDHISICTGIRRSIHKTDDAQIVATLDQFLGRACIDHADQWLALHDMDLTQPGHMPPILPANAPPVM